MRKVNMNKNIGMLLLGIWLAVTGLMQFASIPLPAMVLPLLAIVAGVLIIIGR